MFDTIFCFQQIFKYIFHSDIMILHKSNILHSAMFSSLVITAYGSMELWYILHVAWSHVTYFKLGLYWVRYYGI